MLPDQLFARLKHDWQWMPWISRMLDRLWNKGFWFEWYPAVVRLFPKATLGKQDAAYKVPKVWVIFERALQRNLPELYKAIERVAAGWINARSKGKPIPGDLKNYKGDTVAEPVGTAGNVYEVIDQTPRAVKLRMMRTGDTPPDPKLVNYAKTPWLVQLWTSVSRWGTQGWATGKPLYTPNLADQDGLWVAKERVEFFPRLPMRVHVTTAKLNVRNLPDGPNVIGQLELDEQVTIVEYAPRGSNVWAKIEVPGLSSGGWICVAFTVPGRTDKRATQYYTSWQMETAPPLAQRN
jgi:hypothetical protein